MTAPTVESEITDIVRQAISEHGKKHDALIPILGEINNKLGYIPAEAFREVQQQLHDPAKQMYLQRASCLHWRVFMKCYPRNRAENM
ncbi:MAG: hypothetical protein IPJ46_20210 [Anaerolineales bacterium]|nr:hypothetical protein [Anaerolineales bacterium]